MNIKTPASRATDPKSSHEAEENITDCGKRQAQIDLILKQVEESPGQTSGEIAKALTELGHSMDNVMVSRRLSDMKGLTIKQGDYRKCSAKGTKMITWLPIGAPIASQWNCYVLAGKDREDRVARLSEVPAAMRDSVRNHVLTVYNLKKKAELKRGD